MCPGVKKDPAVRTSRSSGNVGDKEEGPYERGPLVYGKRKSGDEFIEEDLRKGLVEYILVCVRVCVR